MTNRWSVALLLPSIASLIFASHATLIGCASIDSGTKWPGNIYSATHSQEVMLEACQAMTSQMIKRLKAARVQSHPQSAFAIKHLVSREEHKPAQARHVVSRKVSGNPRTLQLHLPPDSRVKFLCYPGKVLRSVAAHCRNFIRFALGNLGLPRKKQ